MDVGDLSPVEQTALLTEYARAVDARLPEPLLGDPLAERTVAQLDFDFTTLGVTPSVRSLVALRAKMLDEKIATFVAAHPDAVVVDIGAGLNSVLFRIAPPPTVDWYSVDLPAVIALREKVLPTHDRSRSVAASLTEPQWTNSIPADRPTLVLADGLFAFLTEPVVIAILRRITEHFGSGVVVFNDYGPVSRLNRIMGKLATRGANSPHSQWDFPGFKDAHHPESWAPRLRLLAEASVMQRPEAAAFPPALRLAGRLSRWVPAIARKARVLQYGF
ncbi:class I SAM-dependent methyltransferase [Mycolicibacterium sp.]|uniref:class I SAM-dependent methyltransferase n=1 Tax=Mycolicibacterium sp. TaxID=2320850 RepID=UPI003D1499CF